MRAVVTDRYGPPEVQRLEEVDRPTPRDDEILVRVHATTVNRSDCWIRSGEPALGRVVTGLRRPRWRILGSEFAGEVEGAGAAVREFRPGDRVFGVNAWRLGAHAEFVCVRESAPVATMPAGMAFTDAAAICDGAILALNCLRPARLRAGGRVLVYGASGSIGTAGVQLAKRFGAHVTAVCAGDGVALARTLGADDVVDYTRDDFTRAGPIYDVVFDAVGKQSFRRCRGSLRPGGAYLATDGVANLGLALLTARTSRRRVVFTIPPRYRKQDVLFLRSLIEAGQYRAVVDRGYALADVVAATRYVETERKLGNVVLGVSPGPPRPPGAQ
jgi:NADPH:quinone reductase-like Zn-dependent oxidoreductase